MVGKNSNDSAKGDPIGKAALRVFAGVGYDIASVQMIADAAGVDPREIRDRGGKNGLYREILENFRQAQSAMLDRLEEVYTSDEAGFLSFVEGTLDFYLDHPYEMAIWQHRGLGDAVDLAGSEDLYRIPVLRRIAEITGLDIMQNPYSRMFSNQLTWSLRGFLFGGILGEGGRVWGPESPEGRRQFREQMHQLRDLLIDSGLIEVVRSGRPAR